jgi:hypothetical protein
MCREMSASNVGLENRGLSSLRNVAKCFPNCKQLHSRRQYSSFYSHTRPPTHPDSRSSYAPEDPAQVRIGYVYVQTYVYMQWNPVEMQTPTRWNSINSSMAALQPVLSPNSILIPPSCHFALIPLKKSSAGISKVLSFQYFYFFIFACLKLRKSETVELTPLFNTCEILAGLTVPNSVFQYLPIVFP